MIQGRMFRDIAEDYDAFYSYGVGAMCWNLGHQNNRRALYFLAPCDSLRGSETARILTMTDGKDWTHPGSVSGWDGNPEQPTFHPSIWLRDRKGWHGYIRAGNLIDA